MHESEPTIFLSNDPHHDKLHQNALEWILQLELTKYCDFFALLYYSVLSTQFAIGPMLNDHPNTSTTSGRPKHVAGVDNTLLTRCSALFIPNAAQRQKIKHV